MKVDLTNPVNRADVTSQALTEIVHDGFELVRQMFAAQNEKIAKLEARVRVLEGEDVPAPSAGDEPETVGADVYRQVMVAISDFTGECDSHEPACDGTIVPGEEIVVTAQGWRHRDCSH